MAIEACPHCARKVIFDNEGKCPACGQSKYISSQKSREQIIYETGKRDAIEKIRYYNKRGRKLIIGGIFLIFLVAGILLFLFLYATISIYWSGGLILGLSMIGKGLIDKRNIKELIYFFEKKYNEKLPDK